MLPRSYKSRRQLDEPIFEKAKRGGWRLKIPKFYAHLFELEEPEIMEKSNTGWRDSGEAGNKYAYFENLTEDELIRITEFVNTYRELIVLDLNAHTEDFFSNELDLCFALGWPAENPTELKNGNRSKVGALVNLIKYKKQTNKADELAELLIPAFRQMLKGKINNQVSLSFVPSDNYDSFYLPKCLAEKMAADSSLSKYLDKINPIVQAQLSTKPDKVKNISIKAKLLVSMRLYTSEKVALACPVKGRDIVVIDDFYQSGTTIWSYARLLKQLGASKVFGLVCEKNFRDSDNL